MSELEFADIRLTSEAHRTVPDVTFAGGIEQRGEYLPFGEQMGLYEEVYFSSEQALSQKNAQITLSFRMNFLADPFRNVRPGPEERLEAYYETGRFYPGSGI